MSGYASPATAVSGPLSDSLLNSYKAALDFLSNPPAALIIQLGATSNISNSSSGFTAVTLDTLGYDTVGSCWSSSAPTKYIAAVPGRYLVRAKVAFSGTSGGGVRYACPRRNGIVIASSPVGFDTWSDSHGLVVAAEHEVILGVGDYVECAGQQSSGAALPTEITTSACSSLYVRWVSTS